MNIHLTLRETFKEDLGRERNQTLTRNGQWWALWDSNPRPIPCKGSALPTELNAPVYLLRAPGGI